MLRQLRINNLEMRRGVIGLALVALAGGLLLGCQTFGGAKDAPPELELKLTLDKQSYQPGEAVQAEIALVNTGAREKQLWKPNAQSVRFFFGQVNAPERMEREAVASKNESMDESKALAPGESAARTFILTRLTEFPGQITVMAHYTPAKTPVKGLPPKVYGNVVTINVGGPRLFTRDPDGLITTQEAIKLAMKAAGGDPQDTRAIWIEDEKGFYNVWVNVMLKGGVIKAWFIDPYFGSVWREAKPFDPKLAEDARLKRPANLPPMAPKSAKSLKR